MATNIRTATTTATLSPLDIFASQYQESLRVHPLATQVETGIALAILGDAIAQSMANNNNNHHHHQQQQHHLPQYDVKRAVSFALFDGCYRVFQHFLYPILIDACRGEWLYPIFQDSAPALEQALVSQLLIIPIFYYPLFYGVTGFVQGLDVVQTIQRAKANFRSIMVRNWMYWIPVQYMVFAYVPETAQISALTGAGLVWTIVLSILAGAATTTTTTSTTTKVLARPENITLLGVATRIGINPNNNENMLLTTPTTIYNTILLNEDDTESSTTTDAESLLSIESVSSSSSRGHRQPIMSTAKESPF